MLRRGETMLVAVGLAALGLAALLAGLSSPEGFEDRRLSTFLTGPHGAKGLAETLRRLGLQVRARRRALFDVADDSSALGPASLLAFLDIYYPPTAEEIAAVRQYVARGGRILVAGYTRIERCFGYRIRRAWGVRSRDAREGPARPDVVPPDPSWKLEQPGWVLGRLPAESLRSVGPRGEEAAPSCTPPLALGVDTLLRTADGRPVALRLRYRRGGAALLLAEPSYLTNQALKETDAGLLVVPWMLAGGTRRVVVDEYHWGFGEGGSLFGAAWTWLTSNPAGWALLQLAAVGLVWLAVSAVRFGPARGVIEHRRRSPLEHLEALAAGLERAGGADTAVSLAVTGLRRRLSRGGYVPRDDDRSWLAALELALPTAHGRDAARRLQAVTTQPGGAERVLATAQAVEDVWRELRPHQPPNGS